MNAKALIFLLVLIAAVGGAYFLLQDKGSNVQVTHIRVGERLLPNLEDQLNDVVEVQIIAPGNKQTVALKRVDNGWVVAERNGFPADVGELRKQLLALAQAKIIETKTANPDLYAKLQVQAISTSDGTNRELRLKLAEKHDMGVIIGKPGPQPNSSRYVRLSNEETSWLIDKNIVIDQDVAHWLQKDIFDIKANRIAHIEITASDDSIISLVNKDPATSQFQPGKIEKEGDEFAEALTQMVVNAFDSFQLLDVLPSGEQNGDWKKISVGKVETFDGIVIQFVTYQHGDDHYITIKSHFDEDLVNQKALDELKKQGNHYAVDDAKKLVAEIRAISEDWVYKIPNVTFDALSQTYEDMLVIVDE